MTPFWHAFRDVLIGLRAGEDAPVSKYKVELEHASDRSKEERKRELHLLEFRARNIVSAQKRVVERTLRRLQAAHDHSVKVIERVEKELNENYSVNTVAKKEREKAEIQFERWRKAVGRPPYRMGHHSLVDRLRLTLEPVPNSDGGITSMASTIDTNGSSPRVRHLVSVVTKLFGIVVIPLDTLYAIPGFEVLLDNSFIAYISAVILGFIFIFLGTVLAHLAPRAYSHSLNEEGQIVGTFKKLPTTLFVIAIIVSITTVYAATTIRSIVPEASVELTNIDEFVTEIESLEQRIQTLENPEFELVKIVALRKDLTLAEDEINSLRKSVLPRFTADALIALCFYSLGILSVMISKLAEYDPVFEYELAALAYGSALHTEVEIANSINSGRARADALLATLNVNIEDQEKSMEDVQLDEARKASIEDKNIEISALEADDRAKIKRETLAYAKYFRLLTRNEESIREWERIYS